MVLGCDNPVIGEEANIGITPDPQWHLRAVVHAGHIGLWICHKRSRTGNARFLLGLRRNLWRIALSRALRCGLMRLNFLQASLQLLDPLQQLLHQNMIIVDRAGILLRESERWHDRGSAQAEY